MGPIDADGGVVPQHRALGLGGVEIRTLVDDLAVGQQGHEAMRKTRRDQQLHAVLGAQLIPHPVSVGGAAAANIHRHVKDRPPATAHQLGLRMGRSLEMQAAHGADLGGQRVIVLYEIYVDAMLGHPLAVPCLGKEAAMVAKAGGCDRIDP